MRILVTGGAGYIGSHVIRALKASARDAIALDDMSLGLRARVKDVELVELDLAADNATEKLSQILKDQKINGVIHLAARKSVAESVARPEYYYQQNVVSVINLLEAMKLAGVNRLVFSSSAAAYGSPDIAQVTEDYPCQPINPYGETKLIGEWLISNAEKAWGLDAVALRYFNVAGTGSAELADTSIANLIPIALDAIANKRAVQVFGSDWPTKDGSCVRDYVHVSDLADSHVAALDYLDRDVREHMVFNVGTGKGSSVLEVIQIMKEVLGEDFAVELTDRRPGDPAALAADVTRIQEVLGWKAQFNLRDIIESAFIATQR
ncbi:MAG: UDP-glucose 4-epimerase GalE [Rhodoluna sp.]